MAEITTTTPTPGSDAAVKAGCVCAREDNAFGLGAMGSRDEMAFFWTRNDCPLHGKAAQRRQAQERQREAQTALGNEDYFDIDIIGGADLPPERMRADLVPPPGMVAVTETDLDVIRLLTLHPQLQPQFLPVDLQAMSDPEKHTLFREMQTALGIVPLRDAMGEESQ